MRLIVLFLIGLALLFFGVHAQESSAHHFASKSGAKLETKYRACKRFSKVSKVARCEITRAAVHYGQSPALAIRVADCESDFQWWLDGYYEGMFQFLWSTWYTTPYAKRSPYSAKWNSLAAMWMWRAGRSGEWGRCL